MLYATGIFTSTGTIKQSFLVLFSKKELLALASIYHVLEGRVEKTAIEEQVLADNIA